MQRSTYAGIGSAIGTIAGLVAHDLYFPNHEWLAIGIGVAICVTIAYSIYFQRAARSKATSA